MIKRLNFIAHQIEKAMTNQTFTRQQLYDLVWSTPMTTLAKKYGVSDARLRKICAEMDVPLPKAGHWEKIRAGKEVEIKELSRDYSGKEETTLEISSQENVSLETPLQKLMGEIENDLESFLIVPDKLSKPDELVTSASQKLKSKDVYGGYVSSWESPLNIDVTPVNLGRALRFMDAFIKLMRERGHKVVIKDKKAQIVVNGEELPMEVREKKKRVLTPNNYGYKDAQDSPSGILCFRVWGKFNRTVEWKDGRVPIEKQLSKILASLEILSEEMKEYQRKLEGGLGRASKERKNSKKLRKKKGRRAIWI